MKLPMRKTRELELEIDEFLDLVLKAALLFQEGIKKYMEEDEEGFEYLRAQIVNHESRADAIRRSVESKLYLHTLIPDMRGDVLGLLESTDKVINQLANTVNQYAVEIPMIPGSLGPMFFELACATASTVESMVLAIRTYFRDPEQVRDQISKCMFYEKQSDQISDRIKRLVFRMDIKLSQKFHVRYFAFHIEGIADQAEDVCDRLAIAAIKRSV
ncbi:MAG: DUF47 family protein [Ignavibacteria bacterium]|nr:DUF47 family protein [Ignavibacteria bacterium]